MKYVDMIIEASEYKQALNAEKRWQSQFRVRTSQSPAGRMKPEESVDVTFDLIDLRDSLRELEMRNLNHQGLVALGRTLAMLLLPPTTKKKEIGTSLRDLFRSSLIAIGKDDRLRLRLQLPSELSALPWEYIYVDKAGGGEGMDGFLALDPRIAIIRDEALTIPAHLPLITGDIKIIAALASNINLPPLNLAKEKTNLENALAGQAGVQLKFLKQATLDELQSALVNASVFHFAGHGVFVREMGEKPGTYTGTGGVAFEDQFVEAEQLGINLHHHGVRLAVLGGCETSRRDMGGSVWSGVGQALVKAEIPAVVANQYSIQDKCAIAFSKRFYLALTGGLSIEAATSEGRIAAYNADIESRDWGVPVLYLRAADGQLFEGASDTKVRAVARAETEADISVHTKNVLAGGEVIGAEIADMLEGKLTARVAVSGTVSGNVTGMIIEGSGLRGMILNAEVNVQDVLDGGKVIGATIGPRHPNRDIGTKPEPKQE